MTANSSDPPLDDTGSWRDWLGSHLRLEGQGKFEIYRSVASSATLRDATYWAEIFFSAGIATLGLTLGSPAVIIGAMLISPLMGPIMAAGLAVAAGDFLLAMRAALNIVLSGLAAIAFSTLLVTLLPFREMTSEIAARTHPNTLDLVIALFSGAVGALAVSKSLRGIATSVPGVAIAVALMPPLCVTGYGVGVLLTVDRLQGLSIVRGGGLLFVTNLVAITFSSMLVFLLLHIDSEAVRERIRAWRSDDPESARFQRTVDRLVPDSVERIGSLPARILLVAAMVGIIFVPLKRSFDALSTEIRQRQQLNDTKRAAAAAWEELFASTSRGAARSYVDTMEPVERDGRLTLTIRAFISQSISAEERQTYIRTVAGKLRRKVEEIELSLIEIPTSTYQVAKAKLEAEAAPAPPPETLGARLGRSGQEAIRQVGGTALPPGAVPLDAAITLRPQSTTVTIDYLSAAPISDDARALIAGRLREQLDLPQLEVLLAHVPARTPVRFRERRSALDGDSAQPLDSLADVLRARPELRAVLYAGDSDRLARARIAAVRGALVARGVADAAIATASSEGVAATEILVVLERMGRAP